MPPSGIATPMSNPTSRRKSKHYGWVTSGERKRVSSGERRGGAERGMDVAARHGDDPGEHAAARLVDGARVGPPARRELELAGDPFPPGDRLPDGPLEPRDAREVAKPFQQIEGVRHFFRDGRKEPRPSRPG